jgi:hypothetical protein
MGARSGLVVARVGVALGLAWAPPVLADPTPATWSLEGSYVPASLEADRAALEAAIERTAAPFFFALRPLVRSRLRETNPMFPAIDLKLAGAAVDCHTPPVRVVAADGAAPTTVIGLDGKPNSATHRRAGDALVQRTWTDEGARTTRFEPAGPDGLTLAVEITSPRLAVPLRYELHYRRARP